MRTQGERIGGWLARNSGGIKKLRYGCIKEGKINNSKKEALDKMGNTAGGESMKARELMEAFTAKSENEEGIKPGIKKKIEGKAPTKPNVFSDGSLKMRKGISSS